MGARTEHIRPPYGFQSQKEVEFPPFGGVVISIDGIWHAMAFASLLMYNPLYILSQSRKLPRIRPPWILTQCYYHDMSR